MKYYYAPFEGITGHVYRRVHHQFFPGVDRYYTPFIVATQRGNLRNKELKDILPQNNEGICIVPQVLTNKVEDFQIVAQQAVELGYEEVNLNIGCPSPTVVSKKKGSGLLIDIDILERLLDGIFTNPSCNISIKTRIGIDDYEEFEDILQVYNKYPIEELIIHPRLQKDFYKNHVRESVFAYATRESKNPLCYNGDLFSAYEVEQFCEKKYPISSIMLGRGLLANPALVREIKGQGSLQRKELKEFHDAVLAAYEEILSGDRNVLFKMKELWFYMQHMFLNSSKYMKKIRKAESVAKYKAYVEALFLECDFSCKDGFQPK